MHCKNVCLDTLFYYSSAANVMIFSKAQWDKKGEEGYEKNPAGTDSAGNGIRSHVCHARASDCASFSKCCCMRSCSFRP